MAKISNWSRDKSTEKRLDHVVYQWRNDALSVKRSVRVEKFPETGYRVNYSDSTGGPLAVADSKDDARKRAVRWMKNHPAPDVPESVRRDAMN